MDYKVAVVTLWAEDVPQTAIFYRDVVGLPLKDHHGIMPHFYLGDTILVIAQGKPQAALNSMPVNFPLLGLTVPDFEQAVERLKQHQVVVSPGIVHGAGGRWALFHDPAGNLVELTELS